MKKSNSFFDLDKLNGLEREQLRRLAIRAALDDAKYNNPLSIIAIGISVISMLLHLFI